MRFKVGSFIAIVACLVMAASLLAQSDALSGTWSGDWGPNSADRNAITMEVKFDGKAVTGNITGGRNVTSAIPLTNASFDPKTGAFKAEASVAGRGGAQVHYKIDGKVQGKEMTGSWNHDNRTGDFKLTKK